MYFPTPSISYPEEQKLGFFRFFGFNLAKIGQKLLLRIGIKFKSNYILTLTPFNLLLSGKAKILKFLQNFDFDFFKLQFGQSLEKLFLRIAINFVSNNSLPPAPCFPGQLNLAKLGENLFLETPIYKHLHSLVFSNFDFFFNLAKLGETLLQFG